MVASVGRQICSASVALSTGADVARQVLDIKRAILAFCVSYAAAELKPQRTVNRDPLLDADVAAKFLAEVLRHPKIRRFLSDGHFSVDGHGGGSLGLDQELPRQGRLRRAAGTRA
jgi:hypothetical protein